MKTFDLHSDSSPELIQGMMFATVLGLESLGRSGSNGEIVDRVAEQEELSEEDQQLPTNNGKDTVYRYFMAWARTHLNKAGIIHSEGRALWSLTTESGKIPKSKAECAELYRLNELSRRSQQEQTSSPGQVEHEHEDVNQQGWSFEEESPQVGAPRWQDELLAVLKAMSPDAFERLSQRILREAGFSRVQVLGQTNDGGLDGVGVLRINLLSFHVYFQCKRYKGSVGSKEIRDFRGALEGRANHGLFITTGTFTSEAQKEASRDGAKPIDLIDGDLLCETLERLQVGVETEEVVERMTTIDTGFFNEL